MGCRGSTASPLTNEEMLKFLGGSFYL